MTTLGLLLTVASVVLVHRAFADSSWAKVIPILERDGYTAIAVQNPRTSLTDDATTTKQSIDPQRDKDLVKGHSYGAMAITAVVAGNPSVMALVDIAALAPQANEVLAVPKANFARPALNSALVYDDASLLYVDRAKLRDAYCSNVPEAKAPGTAVTQKPVSGSAFAAVVPGAVFKSSHLPFLSHSKEAVKVIEAAATATAVRAGI